ncbi:glycosyltransferase involved in cell wall biosynthesis [Paraburkholderia caballeronis]|uniref:glycosyltransferase family 2 protein n=1 Tax=Paraburkholderia caballeronis TaxID=416943 RepID=UPI001066F13D|nr:glycosyltransferase family 2 protein [Paraburkholderia caballeronis]TDV34718.1 glycosyltransferase involved in cell wall biosynthesis [Paraburkholderia caballeronis]
MVDKDFSGPLLSIAIPTFNRAGYLELCLSQFLPEADLADNGTLEIIVSDNCSADETGKVVESLRARGLAVRYIRNQTNIGSDANIAQCFNEASGHYVQILGDDDLYLPGRLRQIVALLGERERGLVCLKPYGYEHDFLKERPSGATGRLDCEHAADFLYEIGALVTFISSCIINKRLLPDIDARSYCGSNLVQVHLVVQAILRCPLNSYVLDYTLACKRANSGGYDFSEIFVENFFRVLKQYEAAGLERDAVKRLGTRLLISYYPSNLLRQRLARQGDARTTYRRFSAHFGGQFAFLLFCAPIIALPRPLGIAWGWGAVFVGRVWNGELVRGWHFALHRLSSMLRSG